MNITSRQLKAFLLTAQHQSFSRAAEQLFITQSGMSVLVRGLEEQLGFRLFDRTTRRVTLTQSGVRFLPVADQSLVALESAVASIGAASESGHDLRVGATPLVAAELLPVAIAQYAKLRPKVKIRLFDIHRPRLIEMAQGGEIDVGLTACPHPAPGLSKVPLVRFSDIAGRKLIGSPPEMPVQELIDLHLRRAGRLTPPDIVCNYMETQVAMVEVGAGLAVLPTLALPACIKRAVTMHALVDPVAPGTLSWTETRARKPPAVAQGFSAFLKEYLSGILESWPPASVRAA